VKRTSSLLAVFWIVTAAGLAQSRTEDDHGLVIDILKQMKVSGRFAIPTRQQQTQSFRQFTQQDTNEDGALSISEFLTRDNDNGEQFRKRIFRIADIDSDGVLSHEEFRENYVVIDEANSIFETLDLDKSGKVTEKEFAEHIQIDGINSDKAAFILFDATKDGNLDRSEVVTALSKWMRLEQPQVTARLIVKQKVYRLPVEYQTESFRRRIEQETDIDKLPPVPKVSLILVLKNVGSEPVIVWPRGSIDEPALSVTGDGLVRPENLRGAGGSSSGTTPQPVIHPGRTFRIKVSSLNPLENFIDNVYWTKPGEYRISASYPVYQNLPPHLPELFPNQPQPTGKPKRFIVTTKSVTVQVSDTVK